MLFSFCVLFVLHGFVVTVFNCFVIVVVKVCNGFNCSLIVVVMVFVVVFKAF